MSTTGFNALEKTVTLQTSQGNITWGDGKNFVLFAGPDIIEDEGMVLETGKEIQRVTKALGIPWILKCSFDKANRQSLGSFRGPGADSALKSLEKIKTALNCPLLTDVHETIQVEDTAKVADVLQIPAFLSRQTDLLVAAAKTQKVIHIKKGQFLAPWDMKAIANKAVAAGNNKLLLCERGTTFGYNRLINDMTGLVEMRKLGFPVIMDATHSTQLPGATGESSGGRGEMVWPLARAAMAVGVDGIFLETHPNPEVALCDGPTSLPLKNLEAMLKNLQKIWQSHF
ncbi:3-deoxy-8-phosphooctulonate synthase [Bdellovibrio sp. HCB337]|uniref:3-deoxy-8-phosphooctulonate synthase n=1 Tax=Bdellovibrio sp. HCB337 TaxID=3394358 RepID=UPI0039A44C5E